MRISGFSYVRNGFNYGVPFLESFLSILPVCDELVVAVGDSTDGTREAIASLNNPKIKIIDTVWDMSVRSGGKTFAQQANIALDEISGDWAFHIQADEVIHENDLPKIKAAIEANDRNEKVEGFILPFLHFWGDYRHIRHSRRMHRYEIRIFRNNQLVRAYRDSQGFRAYDSVEGYENETDRGRKLYVKKIDAPIYHYTGVRSQDLMRTKEAEFAYQYGYDVDPARKQLPYNFHQIDRVKKFEGTHPMVMKPQLDAYDFVFEHDKKLAEWKWKDRIIQPIEDLIGYRFGEYKNYILL